MSDCPPASLPGSSPFRLHGSFESSDLDEIRSVAGAAQHPFTVQPGLRTSHMRFRLEHHPLSRVALTQAELDYQGQLHIWAPPLERHYFLQIPLRGGAVVRHGARTVAVASGKAAVVLSPGPETRMRGHGGFEEITLEIDAAAVRRCWTDLAGGPPDEPISFHPALRLDSEPGASIVRLVRFLAEEVSRPGSALATSPTLGRLEEALILCLLHRGSPTRWGSRCDGAPRSRPPVWSATPRRGWRRMSQSRSPWRRSRKLRV